MCKRHMKSWFSTLHIKKELAQINKKAFEKEISDAKLHHFGFPQLLKTSLTPS